MNIHEYQARELFEKFGVATSKGRVATTPEEASAIARELGSVQIVVKAQIHAGGRGKGTSQNGSKAASISAPRLRKPARSLPKCWARRSSRIRPDRPAK